MPTTEYTDLDLGAYYIGARTDITGDVDAVHDAEGDEMRIPNAFHVEGAITTNAFKVAAQTVPTMSVKVGSGSALTDVYVVEGLAAGQGNYFARLEGASQNIDIDASEPAAARTDEIYLVFHDFPYDANAAGTAGAGIAKAQLAYRKGDAGGTAPGPHASWKAYAKLASIAVAATVTSITNAVITDTRPNASFEGRLAAADLSGQGSVGVIARTVHDPGVVEMYATSNDDIEDIDATDLALEVTFPPSGNVLIRLNGYGASGYAANNDIAIWALREGSTTIASQYMNASDALQRLTAEFDVTGTPGDTRTFKWAHALSVGGASSRYSLIAGGVAGQATMTALALPA